MESLSQIKAQHLFETFYFVFFYINNNLSFNYLNA
jgi:hypothetical protein